MQDYKGAAGVLSSSTPLSQYVGTIKSCATVCPSTDTDLATETDSIGTIYQVAAAGSGEETMTQAHGCEVSPDSSLSLPSWTDCGCW